MIQAQTRQEIGILLLNFKYVKEHWNVQDLNAKFLANDHH
jgi:hypothetical protein